MSQPWVVQLRRIARFNYGEALPSDDRRQGDVPVVGSGGSTDHHASANTGSPVIVIGRKGSVGSVQWFDEPVFAIDTAFFVDQHCTPWDLRWLYYVFQASNFGDSSQDVGIPGLSRDWAYSQLVPAPPPLEEQRRIVDFLDDQVLRIDELLERRATQGLLIEEELREASAELLLGQNVEGARVPTRLTPWAKDKPLHWREIPARYLCTINTGSGDTVDADPDGSYPFYVRSDTAERSNRYTFDCDAVLTSGDGAGVGKVFHRVSGRFHAHQRVYVLTDFRQIGADYFYFYFSSFFRNMALDGSAKSTVDSVRRDMIAGMPFLVPPFNEQGGIVDVLQRQHRATSEGLQILGEATRLLEERKRAVITAAVTGELNVTTARPIGVGKWVPNVGASVDSATAAQVQAPSIGGIG